MIGNVLGNRYRVLREIGAGGMAKVYLAEDIKSSELVAIKLLYPQFSEDLSFVQRFNREAKLASTLTDPHIVRVLDYGADRDLHYLVMELVEGQDLYDRLQEQNYFEWKAALEIIDQLATALEHAHEHGVVHRDIKPQNLMLNENGLLKVLDFGIARMPTLPSLTQSGFIGSPYYASPEQAMGEEVDIRSDIYSSGVVLYELLSGNIPFDAKSPWSIISQHITREPPPIELTDAEIPDDVLKLLNRMLAKRPEDRYQTPTELRQAIAAVLAGQPLPSDDLAAPTSSVDSASLVESLYERASKAIEVKEWLRAADLLRQAARLAPDNPTVSKTLAEVEVQERLISLYRSGKKAMEASRWDEALHHFNVIAEMSPDYSDIQTLIEQCHQGLKRENTQQFLNTRYQEGVAHFETQRWDSAVAALSEVQKLSPGYQESDRLLTEAQKNRQSGFVEQASHFINQNLSQGAWRWGLAVVGLIVILVFGMLMFGGNNQASGDDQVREQLKVLYAEAQAALDAGDKEAAIAKLSEILDEDPDYADVAELRRDLVATATPEQAPLAQMLAEAESAMTGSAWLEVIENLNELRATAPDYERARVASLYCDAYVGRGLELLANIGPEDDQQSLVNQARGNFDAGVTECPRRTDLQEQLDRADTYLLALETPAEDYETLIRLLTPIVAADPDYAAGSARQLLYQAYLERAAVRRAAPETIAAALGDYEAALALNVDDPSAAQTQRAELLLSFTQQPPQPLPAPPESASESPAVETPPASTGSEAVPTPAPLETVTIKYPKPELISPSDDTIYAGRFAELFLEWEPVGELAADEYYDLTIMHLHAGEPRYLGSTSTRDTQVLITQAQDLGVGEAEGDRFYWWVTVRKEGTSAAGGGLDLPLSARSDTRTFIWGL